MSIVSIACGFLIFCRVASYFDEPLKGSIDICHVGNIWVGLDQDTNVRTLRFGKKRPSKIVQSIVRCHGKASSTCGSEPKAPLRLRSFLQLGRINESRRTSNACNYGSCPCKFDMPRLPPLYLEYQVMADNILNADAPEGEKIFLLGLGGGMLPQYLLANSQNISVDVVEIDRDVVHVARSFFGVAATEKTGRLNVTTSDGLTVLSKAPAGNYGRVVIDCADGDHVPAPCRSLPLIQAVHSALRPNGVAMQNVPLGGGHDSDLEPLLELYRQVFGSHAVGVALEERHAGNVVIRATMR